jgi:hypothetical protein
MGKGNLELIEKNQTVSILRNTRVLGGVRACSEEHRPKEKAYVLFTPF